MTLKELIAIKGPRIPKYWECVGPLDHLGNLNGCGAVFDTVIASCPICKGDIYPLSLLYPNEKTIC
jgi:hypothetical protein